MAAALKKSVDEGYKLKISAEMNTVDSGTPISITPDDIQQNSFSIDRYVQTGNTLEVGSACSSELKFIVYNVEKFKGVTFEGAEVIVSGTIPVENSDGEWVDTTVNLGTFTIDEKPRSLALVQIVALDDMVKLDKPCTISDTGTMKTLILSMASECGVNVDTTSLKTCFSAYNNITVTLKFSSETVPTYRQVLSWICQLGLCNAYINVDGFLAFKGFTGSTVSAKITADDRYSHTIEEKAIGVKELTFSEDDLTVTIPQGGNTTAENCIVLDFSKNPLFKPFYEKLSAIAGAFTTWKNKLKTFAYIPFSANIRNFFWLEPMDKITFAKDGTNYETLIMHTTLCPGKAMKIEAKGESPTKSGYAAANPLTAQEQKILDDLRKFVTAETAKVTDREYQLIEFNKAINSGMALHKTTANGVEYYHDQEDITLSDYIMVQKSAGVAWTDSGWNSGSPVWKYGISSNGEAILNSVDAYKIRADLITVTDLKAFNATIGNWHIGDDMLYCGRAGGEISDVWDKSDETADKLYNGLGDQVAHASFYIRNFEVDCEEGDVFYYTGCSYGNYPSYIFFDESGELLSSNVFAQAVTKEEIVAPTGARKAVFQSLSLKSKTDEAPPLIVTRNKTVTPSYTFFKSVTTPSDVVWASGAESLDSYDNAGFLLYGDGRVRMGGNTGTGYVMADRAFLDFYKLSNEGTADHNIEARVGTNATTVTGVDDLGVFLFDEKAGFTVMNSVDLDILVRIAPEDTFEKDAVIETNILGKDKFAAIMHHRSNDSYDSVVKFGCGNIHKNNLITPSVAMECLDFDNQPIARLDIANTRAYKALPTGGYSNHSLSAMTMYRTVSANGESSYWHHGLRKVLFGEYYITANGDLDYTRLDDVWAQSFVASGYVVNSTESIKTNIASTESVLDLFSAESSQIYSYNLKKTVITETEEGSGGDVSTDGDGVIIEEQVEETTSYGFVIGDGYAVPEQVLNKDGNAINLYSMAALTWKAVQELYLKIKALEENANAE